MFEKRRCSLQRLCLKIVHVLCAKHFCHLMNLSKNLFFFFIILDKAYLGSILVQLTHDDWRKVKLGVDKAPRIRIREVVWIFGIFVTIMMIIMTWSYWWWLHERNKINSPHCFFNCWRISFWVDWAAKVVFAFDSHFSHKCWRALQSNESMMIWDFLFLTHLQDNYHTLFSIDWNITNCFLIIHFTILILNSSLPL